MHEQVDPEAWDAAAAAAGGSFVHTHAFARFEASAPNASPVFFRAGDAGGRGAAVAAGALITPRRWPLSRLARELTLPGLPATVGATADATAAALAGVERVARRRGVAVVRVLSYDAPEAAAVLGAAGYRLTPRDEYRLDLSGTADDAWRRLDTDRRRHVRRATRLGYGVDEADGVDQLRTLGALMAASLGRRGVITASVAPWANLAAEAWLARGRALLLVCRRGDEPAAALLYGLHGDRACGLVSGAAPEALAAGAPSLLHWELIRRLIDRGIREVNLGGVDPGAGGAGLARFKRSLGAVATAQPRGFKVLSRPGWLLRAAAVRLRAAGKVVPI